MVWTDDLRRGLLACHATSDPSRRGYMARMHSLWCEMHPEHSSLSQQNLRDYVYHLRRKGFDFKPQDPVAATPHKAEEIKNIAPCPPAATVDIDIKTRFYQLLNSCEYLKDRQRTVHHKISLRAKHLAEMNEILDEFLKDDSDLLTINRAVYAAARLLVTPAPFRVAEKAEQQTKRLDAKLKLERQLVSRIHCVIEYVNSGRRFTTKLRLIARSLKAKYHTLNKNTLLTIKQHSLDKIRALTADRN
ncbi:hypothetical protein L798_13272 [Zootermopsis nevadensis]|uniref:Uncharacterized protein n=1 Tax=Zootermopsis nevadensis TaxID=136037 RepID=A0A067QSZ2_ZOONE|nr:hypothetical protein L798_13272 [Zootermopsis nevadensis]